MDNLIKEIVGSYEEFITTNILLQNELEISSMNDVDKLKKLSVFLKFISKKIKTLFRKYNPKEHWHVEPTEATMDVFTSLTKIIPVDSEHYSIFSLIDNSSNIKIEKIYIINRILLKKRNSFGPIYTINYNIILVIM